jgi:VanZ like family/Concanavalin A-like lectin/glucanases superfamily
MYATLWPFNPYPQNGVSWVPDTNAIRFQHSGVVFSSEPLKAPAAQPAGEDCTIEVYLRPVPIADAGNFLTFSSDDNPDAVFLRQWRESLLIDRVKPARGSAPKFIEFEAENVFRAGQLALLTITSGSHGTSVYIDGKVVATAGHFRIPRSDLYRQIVLGNSPTSFQVWHGDIYGLAVYDDEISPSDAAAHFAAWSAGSPSSSSPGDASHVIARYDFRERSGNIIHSDVASAPPIIIPPHFSIPRKPLLASPFEEFEWNASWRRDVIENILGFMPFGFVLCGLFALSRPRAHAILMATLVGGLLSFTVEFLQYYIPRRDSSLTDVISNSTGTLLGALIAHPELVRAALRLVFLIPSRRKGASNSS